MADVNELISKEAIEGIKIANAEINKLDDSVFKLINLSKDFNSSFSAAGTSINNLKSAQEKANKVSKEYADNQKQSEKTLKTLQITGEKWAKAIDEQEKAMKLNVKTVREAERQNKALRDVLKDVDTTTKAGKKTIDDYNRTIDKNTKLINENADSDKKRTSGIGIYNKALEGVKGALLGVGAALGITGGLAKGFEAVINSTDAGADAFKRTMSGLREQAAYFARSLATIDFSNFIEGMTAARKEGERYYDQLDLIGNLQRAQGLQVMDIDAEITKQKTIAKIHANDLDVRKAAVKEIQRLQQLKLDKQTELGNKEVDNELINASNAAKVRQQYKGEIADFVTNYDKNIKQIERGKKLLEDVRKQTTTVSQIDQYGTTRETVDQNKALILKSRMNEQDRQAVRYAEYENILTDEKRDKIAAALKVQKSATQEQLSGVESLARIENGLNNAEEKASAKAAKAVEKQRDAYQLLTDDVQELEASMMALKIAGQQPTQDMIHELISKKEQIAQVKKEVEGLALGMIAVSGKGTKGISFSGGTDARSILSTKGTGQGAASAPDQFNNSLFDTKGDAQKFAIEGAQVLADTTFNIMANSDQAALDLKLSNLEKEKEAKLKNFKGTEAEKAKLEADYAKKEAKIKTEAAKKTKSANIIQAIMNTALAIGNALATGGAAAPALAIMAGITGAAQMAIIAATKIPQFAGGSLNTPSDFVVGESGPEFMRTKNKGWELVTAPMLKLNAPGSQVISATETRRMMELGITPAGGSNPIPAIEAMHSDIVNTIRGKREVHISASGRKVTETENGNKTSWANRKINWMN